MILQVLDDIFDAYGSYEILNILVEAIDRWDYNYVAQLPEYFNSCYLSLLETMDEVEQELAKEGRTYGVHHFKKQLNRGCQAWLKEAEWRNQKYTPTYNEYMEVAIISVGHILGILALFLGMGPNATKEGFEFVCQDPMPKLVEAAITIFRLMNDLASTKIEQTSRDHVVSSIQCYIKENGIIDEEQAHEFLEKQVENSWKDLNQAMLRPYVMPKPLLDRIRHVTRGTDIFYKGRTDGYTLVNQIIRDKIASVLVHPIPP
ncbi:hypothetical protein BVRB_6g140080 [Beta vulgaris subsp. vulgaris]|nr:hypothetical protein BVRB_6g140080 [Beta vulgaris subsp. vulgaris]